MVSELEDGLWEDVEYIEDFIINANQKELPADRIVRILAAPCQGVSGPSLLVVASKDFRLVFDDVDLWFIQTCAGMLTAVTECSVCKV